MSINTRRLILLGPPLALAVLTVFHPLAHPAELEGSATRWLTLHALQLLLSVFLAYSVWTLLDGMVGRAATIARGALPVFLVFFSAYDTTAGIATGWLAYATDGSGDAETEIRMLFDDNWLSGNISVVGSVSALAWMTVAVGCAFALRRAGADRLTVILMATSLLFINHPVPFGTLGMLAFAAAAYRWERRTGRPTGSLRGDLPDAAAPHDVGATP
jgi:hypothetical protein